MARVVSIVEIYDGKEWVPVRTDNGRLIACLFPEEAGRACMDVISMYAQRGITVHPQAIRAADYAQTTAVPVPVNTAAFGSAGAVGST